MNENEYENNTNTEEINSGETEWVEILLEEEMQEEQNIDPTGAEEERLPEEFIPTDPYPLDEDIALRQEFVKVYNMSSGEKKAVFFADAVHIYDEEKERFVDIDNSLWEDKDCCCYRNKRGCFDVQFSTDGSTSEMVCMKKDEYQITMSLVKEAAFQDAKCAAILQDTVFAETTAVFEQSQEIEDMEIEEESEPMCSKHSESKVVFCDITQNTDFEYEVSGSKIKEDIVIKEKGDTYRYPFRITCENLTMHFSESDRTVLFRSTETDEEIFCIPAPFMTDAAGAYSDEVFYELTQDTLSLAADSEWINAEERVLPVRIDPQIIISNNSPYITTYARASNSNVLTQSSIPDVGTCITCQGNAARTYLKINIPNLPRNPRIKGAELTVCQRNAVNPGAGVGGPKMGAYQVANINAGVYSSSYENLIDFESVSAAYAGAEYTFDITSLLDSSETPGVANVMLKLTDENTMRSSVHLHGNGTGIPDYAPKLTVLYESTYGFDTLTSAPTHSLGRFGKGLVDLQKGKLAIESEDFVWKGSTMPVSIRHYYNGSLSDIQYTNNPSIDLHAGDFSAMSLGKGWSLNWMQSMMPIEADEYVYTGSLGEEIRFQPDTIVTDCTPLEQCYEYYTYKDVNGYGYTYDSCKRELWRRGTCLAGRDRPGYQNGYENESA